MGDFVRNIRLVVVIEAAVAVFMLEFRTF